MLPACVEILEMKNSKLEIQKARRGWAAWAFLIFNLAFLFYPSVTRAVTLTADDGIGASSFNSAGGWSSGVAPGAGNSYSNANFLLRTPATTTTSYTFAGEALTITSSSAVASDLNDALLFKGTFAGNTTLTINNLTFNGGTLRNGSGDGNAFILAGNGVTVGASGMGGHVQGPLIITAPVLGSGPIKIVDPGSTSSARVLTFSNANNTYTGSIELVSSTSSRFALADGANLIFVMGASGVNNSVFGAGIAAFNGRFVFNLTGAATNLGSSWTIVSAATKTFGGTFSVDGFTKQGVGAGPGLWDLNTNGVYYEFNTTNGLLSVVTEPTSSSGTASLGLTSTKFDGVEADVALAYSPDAASRQGGEDNIQVNLANAIAGANAAHKRSGTGVRLRIAGFYQSTANPVDQDNNYVLSLVNGDAAYQDVRDFGASVGADLVSYYSHNTGAAGNAYQPGSYSVMGEQWIYYLVVGHELGHNYGCAHQDGRISPKTVMMHNYCGGGAQGYFSNPQMWINGVQMIGDGDTCLSVALISGGDNANRLAGAAVGVADNRARVIIGPNLTHVVLHWVFTNAPGLIAAGTTNFDLVSGAPAIVRGINATYTGSALRLPGGSTGNVAVNSMAAYIDLPNGIISSRTNLTIEIWATPQSAPNWARLFDFGRTTQAGDGLGAAGEYTGTPGSAAPGSTSSSDDIMLSTDIGTDLNSQRFEAKLDGFATTLDAGLATTAGVPHHYAITFTEGTGAAGSLGGRWQWYRDGDPVAFLDVSNHLASIEDVNNWLGRSMWSDDSMANNDYTEVRISSVAMSPGAVLANFLLGPNYQPTTTVALNASDASGSSSFNAAGQWSSGATPNAANSYETFDYLLRTPATSGAYTFGGNTLKISGGELLYKSTGSSTITVTNLILNGGVVHHSGSGTFTLAGNIAVSTNSAGFNAQNGPLNLTASISGLAPVSYLGNTVTLSGNNSNLLGKTLIGNGVVGAVQIDAESRLGPAPASFTADQLTLNRGTLVTTTTMTLSNTTRGILLDVSGGTFNVAPGTTLTLAGKLSSPSLGANVIAGSLGKAGSGTLVLSTTNTTFYGSLYVDSGSTTANDGVVKVINNQALANARSPIYFRNNNGGYSELQLDGTASGINLSQAVSLSGRTIGSVSIRNVAGTNSIAGGLTMNVGGGIYYLQSDAGQLSLGGTITSAATGARTLTFYGAGNYRVTGSITDGSATMNLVKNNGGMLTLGGANTYSGTTALNGGTMLVNGATGVGGVTVASSATLGGSGTINGPVTVQSGGTLAPGNSIGVLTVSNNVSLAGTTLMEISRSPLTNDQLRVTGTLNYNGTLSVVNLSGALAGGDSFKLFSAASSSGNFSTLAGSPGTGLAWTLNTNSGVLTVYSTVPTNITALVTNNALQLSWPADHLGWTLQTQTNSLSAGLGTNWVSIGGSATNTQFLAPLDAGNPSVFYRLIYP